MNEGLPTHKQFESNVTKETIQKHSKEIEIMVGLINTYISGFNLVTSFTHKEGRNDVTFALICLVMHSLHSMWCSLGLMIKGYYSQAMAIIRTSIEDWFICGDCKSNRKTLDAILYGKYRIPDSNEGLSFSKMAKLINRLKVYEQDYAYTSKFSHPSSLGMAILQDEKANFMRIAPTYEEILFLDCCEMWIRNSLRMTEYMESILASISTEKVETWRWDVGKRVADAWNWLKDIQKQYGKTNRAENNQP